LGWYLPEEPKYFPTFLSKLPCFSIIGKQMGVGGRFYPFCPTGRFTGRFEGALAVKLRRGLPIYLSGVPSAKEGTKAIGEDEGQNSLPDSDVPLQKSIFQCHSAVQIEERSLSLCFRIPAPILQCMDNNIQHWRRNERQREN